LSLLSFSRNGLETSCLLNIDNYQYNYELYFIVLVTYSVDFFVPLLLFLFINFHLAVSYKQLVLIIILIIIFFLLCVPAVVNRGIVFSADHLCVCRCICLCVCMYVHGKTDQKLV